MISLGRSDGSTSNTVLRPSGSRLVVTTPAGLWNRNSRVRSTGGSGLPSSSITSSAVTLKAGLSSTLPLTRTRPAAISSSASRREAMPTRASRLAMRSPSASSAEAGRRAKVFLAAKGVAASGECFSKGLRFGAPPGAGRLVEAFAVPRVAVAARMIALEPACRASLVMRVGCVALLEEWSSFRSHRPLCLSGRGGAALARLGAFVTSGPLLVLAARPERLAVGARTTAHRPLCLSGGGSAALARLGAP